MMPHFQVPVGHGASTPASQAASPENRMDKSRSSTPSVDANFKRYSAELNILEEQNYMSSSPKSNGGSGKDALGDAYVKEVHSRLFKQPLKFNGSLATIGLNYSVKVATCDRKMVQYPLIATQN